jgi:hypothetical protein
MNFSFKKNFVVVLADKYSSKLKLLIGNLSAILYVSINIFFKLFIVETLY